MIRINLATRKQPAFVAAEGSSGGGAGKFDLSSLKIDTEALKDLPLRKAVLSLVVIILGSYVLSDYKAGEINKLDTQITSLNQENAQLTAKVNQTKGYEQVKIQLEKDEFLIRSKINTIKSLMNGRGESADLLISLSKSIPKETLLSNFQMVKEKITLTGKAVDYDFVSELMKNLGESVYFADLDLKRSARKVDDKVGQEVTEFEVTAIRSKPE